MIKISIDEFVKRYITSNDKSIISYTWFASSTGISKTEAKERLEQIANDGKLFRSYEYVCPHCYHGLVIDNYNDPDTGECIVCDRLIEGDKSLSYCRNNLYRNYQLTDRSLKNVLED